MNIEGETKDKNALFEVTALDGKIDEMVFGVSFIRRRIKFLILNETDGFVLMPSEFFKPMGAVPFKIISKVTGKIYSAYSSVTNGSLSVFFAVFDNDNWVMVSADEYIYYRGI